MNYLIYLKTENLILRDFKENDIDELYDYRNNEQCSKHQRGQKNKREDLISLIKRTPNYNLDKDNKGDDDMSIINSFDENKKAVINLDDVREKSKISLDTLILTFSKKIIDMLLEDKLIEEIKEIDVNGANGHYPVYKIKDTNIGIYMTMVGAPITVALLEEISYVTDTKNIILFGNCGTLSNKITAGKIIIPTEAYRDEGTSYHYIKPSDYIKITNCNKVAEILNSLNVDYILGKTWTTDGFYRETQANLEKRKADGCICVEMEISAVQAVCDFRGYNFYPFIYAADNLDSSKWDRRILCDNVHDFKLSYFYLALEIARNIC